MNGWNNNKFWAHLLGLFWNIHSCNDQNNPSFLGLSWLQTCQNQLTVSLWRFYSHSGIRVAREQTTGLFQLFLFRNRPQKCALYVQICTKSYQVWGPLALASHMKHRVGKRCGSCALLALETQLLTSPTDRFSCERQWCGDSCQMIFLNICQTDCCCHYVWSWRYQWPESTTKQAAD